IAAKASLHLNGTQGPCGILPNDVHNLLPQGNRKRALQVFDQIVHAFYSTDVRTRSAGNANVCFSDTGMLACDIARGRRITEFTEPKLTAMANSCVLETFTSKEGVHIDS